MVVRAGIPIRRYLLPGLILVLLGGCSPKSPTSPAFAFEGEWSGTWSDITLISSWTYKPISPPLTIKIDADGIADVDARFVQQYANGNLVERLRMNLQVWPDGSVYGTGSWNQAIPGGTEVIRSGEVIGQFDERTDSGSGALIVDYYGTTIHQVWKVTRSR